MPLRMSADTWVVLPRLRRLRKRASPDLFEDTRRFLRQVATAGRQTSLAHAHTCEAVKAKRALKALCRVSCRNPK